MIDYTITPKISIIGGGLSSVFSFWGALDAGYAPNEVEIIYVNRAIPMGAVFIYEAPMPWPPTNVVSILIGTCDEYSKKQWRQVRKTSAHRRFDKGEHPAVVEQLYLYEEMKTTLWSMIPRTRESPALSNEYIEDLKKNRIAVIATFANQDRKKEYIQNNFAIQIPVYSNTVNSDKNVVIYNGLPFVPWVRQTITPGRMSVEYPHYYTDPTPIMSYEHRRDNGGGTLTMIPDLHPDCPNLEWSERIEDNLFRVGRFAAFIPGYLSHMARQDTMRFLSNL